MSQRLPKLDSTTTSMKIYSINKDTIIENGDYVFEKMKEYTRIEEYLKYPKIGSRWKIILVNFPIQNVRDIAEKEFKHVDFIFYLKSDVVGLLREEMPEMFGDDKSSYEKYLDLVSTFPVTFDGTASRELYKRTGGSIELIKEVFKYLEEEYLVEEVITKKHIAEAILPDNRVFQRDVALSLLLCNNDEVPKRGSYLSRYRYGSWRKRFIEYQNSLSPEVAFYAMRKYFNELYDRKYSYLTVPGFECKDLGVIKVVDIITLTYIKILFMSSNPKQLYSILLCIEERLTGDSIIKPEDVVHGDERNFAMQR